MKSFALSDASQAEARPQHPKVPSVDRNRMRNGRFSLTSLSVKPDSADAFVFDPAIDIVQNTGSRAIQTPLLLDQSNFARAN